MSLTLKNSGMQNVSPIDDRSLEPLLNRLASLAGSLNTSSDWPGSQLEACGESGVFRWFSSPDWGGTACSHADIYQGYMKLAAHCLTTTFVITQRQGASRRIEDSENEPLKKQLLPKLNRGEIFATVGISHLTTSRQHLDKPVLRANPSGDNLWLQGYSPWVTGGRAADWLVVGATLPDDQQVLLAVDARLPGVEAHSPNELMALSASQTGEVWFEDVVVHRRFLIAGPARDVMRTGAGGSTGGLQTSALALGLARAAIDFLIAESAKRPHLEAIASSFVEQWQSARDGLLDLAGMHESSSMEGGESNAHRSMDAAELRSMANSLALRSTQAALSAAKGAGYVAGHPVGRWCREALFFLVWSCPEQVVNANLCEFSGALVP